MLTKTGNSHGLKFSLAYNKFVFHFKSISITTLICFYQFLLNKRNVQWSQWRFYDGANGGLAPQFRVKPPVSNQTHDSLEFTLWGTTKYWG